MEDNNVFHKLQPQEEEQQQGTVSKKPENDVLEVKDVPENQFVKTSAEELGTSPNFEGQKPPDSGSSGARNMPEDDRITEKN